MCRKHTIGLLSVVMFVFTNVADLAAEVTLSSAEAKAEADDAMRKLRSRRESDRLDGLDTLSTSPTDLAKHISQELSSNQAARVVNALKLVRSRPELANTTPFARLLGNEDASVADEAALTLRALGYGQLERTHTDAAALSLDETSRARLQARLLVEARYAATRAVLMLAAAPGYFEEQYSSLLSGGEWVIGALSDVVALSDGVENPMQQAVLCLAAHAKDMPEVDLSFQRLLEASDNVALVAAILAGRKQGELDEKAQQCSAELISRMRRRAAQALGGAPGREYALGKLEALYTELGGASAPTVVGVPGDISLIEELEVSLARQGKAERLNLRLATLQISKPSAQDSTDAKDLDALAQANVAPATLNDNVHPEARKKIAYLRLRAGQLDEAIREYTLLIAQLEDDFSMYGSDLSGVVVPALQDAG